VGRKEDEYKVVQWQGKMRLMRTTHSTEIHILFNNTKKYKKIQKNSVCFIEVELRLWLMMVVVRIEI
jgi:hypothetical protein